MVPARDGAGRAGGCPQTGDARRKLTNGLLRGRAVRPMCRAARKEGGVQNVMAVCLDHLLQAETAGRHRLYPATEFNEHCLLIQALNFQPKFGQASMQFQDAADLTS